MKNRLPAPDSGYRAPSLPMLMPVISSCLPSASWCCCSYHSLQCVPLPLRGKCIIRVWVVLPPGRSSSLFSLSHRRPLFCPFFFFLAPFSVHLSSEIEHRNNNDNRATRRATKLAFPPSGPPAWEAEQTGFLPSTEAKASSTSTSTSSTTCPPCTTPTTTTAATIFTFTSTSCSKHRGVAAAAAEGAAADTARTVRVPGATSGSPVSAALRAGVLFLGLCNSSKAAEGSCLRVNKVGKGCARLGQRGRRQARALDSVKWGRRQAPDGAQMFFTVGRIRGFRLCCDFRCGGAV